MDIQIYRYKINRYIDKYIYFNRYIDIQIYKYIDIYYIDIQIDRERERDRKTDRQTEREQREIIFTQHVLEWFYKK